MLLFSYNRLGVSKMETKKSKLWIIILISVLILGIGGSFAYFVTRVLSNGNGAEVNVKTASKGDTTVTVSGDIETNGTGKYPGHKTLSRIKVTATGEDEVPFNIVWTGTNTLSIPVNYRVYKTTNAVDASVSCEAKQEESFDLSIYYYEECTENISELGEEIEKGVINAGAENEKISFVITELIQATKSGNSVYYYILLEIPNLDESQNIDMGGKIAGELNIEIPNNYNQAYKMILANNILQNGEVDFNKQEPFKTYTDTGFNEITTSKTVTINKYTSRYFTYADSYTYDEATNKYSLVDAQVGIYSNIYENLSGKYIIDTAGSTSSTIEEYTNKVIIYKVVGTPNMEEFTYTSSKDNFVEEKKRVLHQHKYVAYADSYTFDEESGKFTLVNAQSGKWCEVYDKLEGKYVISSNVLTIVANAIKKYPTETIYKVAAGTTKENLATYASVKDAKTDEITTGLYKIEDDDGDSYYFRGNIDNNYVNFAGFSWRIIRINGDKTIRLIYDSSNSSQIANNAFNRSYSGNDNAYVGFMYKETGIGADDEAFTNTTSSTIKTKLDEWYTANLKNYERYIDPNAGFCGDRSISSGTGVAEEETKYQAYTRLIESKTPSLKCPNVSRDLYTLKSSNKGNKALDNPIGLITADEVSLAGGKNGLINEDYYLNGVDTWTMTPAKYKSDSYVFTSSSITGKYAYKSLAIRPVINLNANVNFTGSGTMEDPYTVS